MQCKPLYDRVVVRAIDAEARSPGGIFIPDNAKEKPTTGEVVAVGPGRKLENGTLVELTVRVGERVLFGQNIGQKVKVNNEDLTILREEELLAIIQ